MDTTHQIIAATSLLLSFFAQPLQAQNQDLPSLDLGATDDKLRGAAMGLSQGCDYVKYLQIADQMQGAFQAIQSAETLKGLFSAASVQRGIPFTDYIKMVMNSVSLRLDNDAAKSLRKGLVLQVEQTCQTVAQGAAMRRILELTRDGQIGANEAIPRLAGVFERSQATAIDNSLKASVDSGVYLSARTVVPVSQQDRADSMLMTMINNAEQTTRFAALALAAIDSIEENLRKISDESFLFATKGTGGSFACPPGYPAPRLAPELTRRQEPICGPAGADRSLQLIRATTEEYARLKVIDSRTIPLLATMEAYQALATGHTQRTSNALVQKVSGF